MASHRKPRAALPAPAGIRTALTLVTAAAASVTVLAPPGHADPRLTADQAKARLDTLYQQAEAATQEYDGAVARAAELQRQAAQLQQQAARTEAAMNGLRTRLGSMAAAQYRDGGMDPTLRLLTTAHPDDYLQLAGSLSQVSSAQQRVLDQYAAQQRSCRQQQAAVAARLSTLQAQQRRISAARTTITSRLAAAQRLLDSLDAAQRAAVQQAESRATAAKTPRPSAAAPAGPTSAPHTEVPVSGRAAAAVAFARAQLGKPYVWGATGPGSFDCSGLTQAAWRAAGVSLPRTTYQQINAGKRVSTGQLRPGDLVFYYSGITHVAIYVGGGRIIHAPHPGAAVEYAPVGEMPISGAVRPA
ncbi:NlpC/P60 family protein [Streptacidiphilus sp. N1-12]|uniref:NlpC/P60 family protein n=2 Tax=Streptacidiphilus alkalitolerans TaxID=3342712 RepID=A0ABV6WD19_9ACTN